MCKAVNTAAHRSGFTLLISVNEKHLGTCIEILEKENYSIAVCYMKHEPQRTKNNCKYRSTRTVLISYKNYWHFFKLGLVCFL